MKNLMKRSFLAITLATLTSSAFAAEVGSAQFGLDNGGIKGWRPYMASIGSQIIVGGEDDGKGGLIPTVGTVIEIPTYTTGNVLFNFVDKDGDIAAGLGYGKLPTGEAATKEFRVEWYIISAPNNDWSKVSSWADVEATAIKIDTAIGDGGNTKNANSHTLVVPEGAAGKRLGFIAYPESEYGVPAEGNPVKAWDLSKIWTQKEPNGPGECETDCDDNGNGNGGENNNGGGGDVIASEYAITVYDAKTQLPLTRASKLTINQEFFATIRIKEGDTYRDPKESELQTLSWNMIDKTGAIKYSYKNDSGRLAQDSATFGPDKLKKYTFTTQATNSKAATQLQETPPNFSEQGWGLSVTLQVE